MLFLKEWFIPTIGKSVGIATITAAIFNVPSDTLVPEPLEKNIYHLFEWTQSNYFFFAMLTSATLVILTLFSKEFSRGADSFWGKLSRKRGLISLTANFLFGAILLPLVVAFTALMKQGHPVNTLIVLAVIYTGISAVFHWLGTDGTHPYTGLLYVVHPISLEAQKELRYKTEIRLNDHVSYCKGTAQVVVLAETNENYLTIFVELDREINCLVPDELAYWHKFLGLVEQEWTNNKIAFARVMDPFSIKTDPELMHSTSIQGNAPSSLSGL